MIDKQNPEEDLSDIQNPPISKLLKWDIKKYENFINHEYLVDVYKSQFLAKFFDFLDYLQEFDQDKQKQILENPMEFGQNENFGIYMNIFDVFIRVYGKDKYDSKYNWFDMYFDIIKEVNQSFIEQTRKEIAEMMKPGYVFNLFKKYTEEDGLNIYDLLLLISDKIWEDEPLKVWSLSVIDIKNHIKYQESAEDRENLIKNFTDDLLIPYFESNPSLCQEYITRRNKQTLELKRAEENQDIYARNIYNEIANFLKENWETRLDIDQRLIYSRPIQNWKDFDKAYNDFVMWIWSKLWEVDFLYSKWDKSTNNNIDFIKHVFSWYEWFEGTAMDLIIKIYKSEIGEDIWDYDEVDDDFEDSYDDEDDSEDEDDSSKLISISSDIRKQMSEYYQMNIIMWYDEDLSLPTFTIKLEKYQNIFDANGEWISFKIEPNPTIIKATFSINDKIHPKFNNNFINWLNSISPNYNALELFGIYK